MAASLQGQTNWGVTPEMRAMNKNPLIGEELDHPSNANEAQDYKSTNLLPLSSAAVQKYKNSLTMISVHFEPDPAKRDVVTQ